MGGRAVLAVRKTRLQKTRGELGGNEEERKTREEKMSSGGEKSDSQS